MAKGKTRPAAPPPARAAALAPERDLPAWVVPVTYALVTVFLFREFFVGGVSMLGIDSFALSYFARDFYLDAVRATGTFPHWQPYLFGGMPFIDGMHGDIFYPLSLLLWFLDARDMWGWKMALHIFLAGVFTFLWLRRGLGLSRGAAFFGGLVYMMGADLVSLVLPGGDGKLFVSALAPLAFFLTERAVRSGRLADFAFFALGITLVVLTSHMQLAYFCIWGVSLYFFFRLWERWREQRSGALAARLAGAFVVAGVLGVGAAAIQFFPPLDYLRETSHRADRTLQTDASSAYQYSTTYSIHPEETLALVVPEFVGHAAQGDQPTYFGRNGFKLNNEYAGLIPLLLLPVLLLRRRERRTWFFIGLGILALLYALGANTPFFRLFYLVPGVKLFRAPSVIIFLYGLSVATLGALALERLLAWRRTEENAVAAKALWIVAGGFGVLALLASAGAISGFWQGVVFRDMRPEQAQAFANNQPFIRTGFWIAFGLALLTAGWWELTRRGTLALRAAVLVLALLAAVDLARAGRPFVRMTAEYNRGAQNSPLFHPEGSIRYLQQVRDAGGVFRVWDIGPFVARDTYGDANVLGVHGIEQIGGHHGNEIGRYRQLVGGDPAPNVLESQLRLLNLLNGEYIVSPQPGLIEALQQGGFDASGLEEVYAGPPTIYRNRNALARAFLVGETEVLDGDAAAARLVAPTFEPRRTALLAEPLPAADAPQPGVQGTVQWEQRALERFTLRVTADRPALLVVMDNWYPAWKARVDGREVPIVRANYSFRGVPVGAGEHTVEFFYDAGYLRTASFASIALMLLLLGVGVGGALARGRREEPAA